MPSFQLKKSESVPLTPEFARQHRDLTPSPTERELQAARLRMLRRKADDGKLVTFHWSTARLGETVYRMNGQHSANMLCELDGAFPQGLYVHLDEYAVDSEADLAELFRQFDDRKSGRSAGDVAGAYQGLEKDLQEVPRRVAKKGIEAVSYYRQEFEQRKDTKKGDDQYSLFHEGDLHPYLQWIATVFNQKTSELFVVPVMAAMYGTWLKNPEAAEEFWDDVAKGGKDYDEDSPQYQLDAWLVRADRPPLPNEEKKRLKPAEYFRGCVYAWNAYREDKKIKEIRFDKRRGQSISD
jgi:hypothetical protein